MIVLVPVSRFRVPYEIAEGRPYSALERVVLSAVADQGSTLRTLKTSFRVHERLLIEALVTLVTAGWIAVAGGREARFVLTSAGREALSTGKDPVSVTVASAHPHLVVMERVTGQIARHTDARSWRKDELGDAWHTAAIMRERILRNSLDEAQVQKLLPRSTGQWVRGIGPITLTSRATHFLPVEVDTDGGHGRGMPSEWYEALLPWVLLCARDSPRREPSAELSPSKPTAARPGGGRRFLGVAAQRAGTSSRRTSLRVDRVDMRVGFAEHDAALATAIATARTSIAIVSPLVVSEPEFRNISSRAASAIKRNVRVDLLAGECGPGTDTAALLAAVNEIGYHADNKSGRSLLRTRDPGTGSGASLLLYDDENEALVAIIGNHPWLATDGTDNVSFGLAVSEQSICADLSRAVASLWVGRSRRDPRWAGPAERWWALAASAEERAAAYEAVDGPRTESGSTSVELLVDDENAAASADSEGVARIGGTVPDESAGEGAVRGLVLRIVGEGAATIARVRGTSKVGEPNGECVSIRVVEH